MDVSIKSFDVEMEVKTKGIELEIREPNNGSRLGDLVITKAHLIWCEGKTQRQNGKKIRWTDFVQMVNASQKPVKAAAKKTVRKTARVATPSADEEAD